MRVVLKADAIDDDGNRFPIEIEARVASWSLGPDGVVRGSLTEPMRFAFAPEPPFDPVPETLKRPKGG
jgi:hypothetical protein